MTKLANTIHEFDRKIIAHRGDSYLKKMYVATPLREIDGHEYVLGVLWDDTKWYLMPADNSMLDEIQDIGPFDEFEEALMHFKLMGDAI